MRDDKSDTQSEVQLAAFLAAFDEFAQAVRRARGGVAATRDGTLTLSQYGVLEPLLERDGARVQELAVGAGVSGPTVTRLLDTLERRELVRRERTEADRRAVSVSLTDRGRRTLIDQHEWLRSRQRAFHAQLPESERALAPELLSRLARLIDELAAGPGA